MSARREFQALHDDLLARRRAGCDVSEGELAALRVPRDAWQADYDRWLAHASAHGPTDHVMNPPPAWDSVVGRLAPGGSAAPSPPAETGKTGTASTAGAGRPQGKVRIEEADKVARIWKANGALSPHDVWTRYNPKQVSVKDDPTLLSRQMVAHLITALDERWLPWDAVQNRLGISDEFRASEETFVIPRSEPAP